MFDKLKQRWGVNSLNLLLIIITFALGGSLCGFAGRRLLEMTFIEKGVFWFILYICLITLLWPICVLLISIPLGQYSFFKRYLIKVWKKLSGKNSNPVNKNQRIRVAVFASGAGSNAQQIINYFNASASVQIALVVCNKAGAGVIDIAQKAGIPVLLINKENLYAGDHYLPHLQKHQIDFIVLAGFLLKIPVKLIHTFPKKIINIHPALLPKFGGSGMYGNRVHQAVVESGEFESGITIHYVDEIYDHGEIIFQARCRVAENDTADTLAKKIHQLEHQHYPGIINEILQKQKPR